ncbi:MAG: 50S ribosomal protein L11 methyltransferase [Deltaproteobacteria bacterium]|nr:50S ribosomal protein L11 methyltransferase [Deltaproteobacteria bacterium]
MTPETELTIYEIRTGHPDNLARFEGDPPETFLGQDLAKNLLGLHLESDFLFLFFDKSVDLAPFLSRFPELELRQTHELRYDQWQDGAGSPPFSVGPLTIRPVFGSGAGPEHGPIGLPEPLLVDPGLAFGFGGHPTTRACLEFLVRLYRPGTTVSPSPGSALDLGCGTGILALAAVRLGAGRALGLDHSHLAVDAANKNARLNRLGHAVTFGRALAQDYAQYPANLVMANIPLFVLRDLVDLGAFVARDYAIVSGLLPEEGEVFLGLLSQSVGHKVLDARRSDRWVSYLIKPCA